MYDLNESVVSQLIDRRAFSKVGVKVTEAKEVSEVEEHVCPLCESKLEEDLSEEVLEEHVRNILEAAEQVISESDEDDDEDIIELTEADLLSMDEDELQELAESLDEDGLETLAEILEEYDCEEDED